MRALAFDVTWNASEWQQGAFEDDGSVQIRFFQNQGGESSVGRFVDYTGFIELGVHDDAGTIGDPYEGARMPNFDSGNAINPGRWDPATYPGTHSRTLYYDISDWIGDGVGSNQSTAGQHYDLREIAYQATQSPGITTDGDEGWMEWIIGVQHDPGYTSGRIYIDNFRFEDVIIEHPDTDFDDDTDVDADDIDILADMIFRGASDPGGFDSADLNGDNVVNQDDMDYMINTVFETIYGDADLDDDVDGGDLDRWRLRDSQGGGIGWATGDFDGDNDVDGADFDLWRLRPLSTGGAGIAAVPEPATLVLVGVALPVLGLIARCRR